MLCHAVYFHLSLFGLVYKQEKIMMWDKTHPFTTLTFHICYITRVMKSNVILDAEIHNNSGCCLILQCKYRLHWDVLLSHERVLLESLCASSAHAVFSGYSGYLLIFRYVHVRMTDDSKLTIRVSLICLCVAL